MPIVHFSKFHSRKTRNKEAYDLSDTAYSGCLLEQQVLTRRSDFMALASVTVTFIVTLSSTNPENLIFAGAGAQNSQGG